MKKLLRMLMVVFVLFVFTSTSFAGKDCGKKKSTKEKFFHAVKLIYSNQEELQMSDEQMDELKEIKIPFKKALIRLEADIDIIKIDIDVAMYADDIDLKVVNDLIDKKYEKKKERAKKTVAALAGLKKILTEEQATALKKICKESNDCKESKGCKGKDCPDCKGKEGKVCPVKK